MSLGLQQEEKCSKWLSSFDVKKLSSSFVAQLIADHTGLWLKPIIQSDLICLVILVSVR